MSAEGTQAQSFSASGEDAIQTSLDVSAEETPSTESKEFIVYYEIERTIQTIEEGDFKRIALQFPDELLHDSVPVYRAIQERLGSEREVYVLADTSYGSCCVDEVAASHVDADALVHYGHACLSQTSRLPVIYVFGRKSLNVETCVDAVSAYITAKADALQDVRVFQLRHDVACSHLIEDLVRLLRLALNERYNIEYERLPNYVVPASSQATTSTGLGDSCSSPGTSTEASPGTIETSSSEKKIVLWIGEESPTLTKLLMTSSGSSVISYSPRSGIVREQTHLTNKLLMRRYALLQQARDADVFGILIGTLGVASYLPLVQHLRQRLKKAHKKSYTVSVGKINPSKLANFMEIECWIWVACSEGMVDSKDYPRPIITPYELELALQPEPDWTGRYIFDFQELLARALLEESENGREIDIDQPMFSLVSGKYRQAKRYGDDSQQNGDETLVGSRDLTSRSENSALSKMADSAAVHFLHGRSYQGLEPRLGQDAPSVLEQGRSGIARGYKDDHPGKSTDDS